MFFMRKSGALSRGSARNQAVGTFADLPLDQPLEGRFVYRPICKWRDQWGVIDPMNNASLLLMIELWSGNITRIRYRSRFRGSKAMRESC
jgi:hypothetical protein